MSRPVRFRADDEHVAEQPQVASSSRRSMPWLRRSEKDQLPYSGKFRNAMLVLLAVGAAALVLALVLTMSGGSSAGRSGTWSSWQPTNGGMDGAQQIADYLSPYYRASSADQLAVVTAMNLNDPSNPMHVVLSSSGSQAGVQALPAQGTIAYNLCGLNSQNCSIGVGQPSSNRLLLLRREALELALYTFKYVSGTQTVVALLPPGHTPSCTGICPKPHAPNSTKPLNIALAFDHKELQPWLNRPLRETLPEQLPPTVAQMPNAPEAELVSVITAHGLFSEHTEQAQDGSNLLVLNPLPPQ